MRVWPIRRRCLVIVVSGDFALSLRCCLLWLFFSNRCYCRAVDEQLRRQDHKSKINFFSNRKLLTAFLLLLLLYFLVYLFSSVSCWAFARHFACHKRIHIVDLHKLFTNKLTYRHEYICIVYIQPYKTAVTRALVAGCAGKDLRQLIKSRTAIRIARCRVLL